MALHLRVKKLTMNSKEASGFRAIASCPRQSATNQHLLKADDSGRKIFFRPIGGLSHCYVRLFDEAKIRGIYYITTRKDSSAFHCFFDLPDFAGHVCLTSKAAALAASRLFPPARLRKCSAKGTMSAIRS